MSFDFKFITRRRIRMYAIDRTVESLTWFGRYSSLVQYQGRKWKQLRNCRSWLSQHNIQWEPCSKGCAVRGWPMATISGGEASVLNQRSVQHQKFILRIGTKMLVFCRTKTLSNPVTCSDRKITKMWSVHHENLLMLLICERVWSHCDSSRIIAIQSERQGIQADRRVIRIWQD